MTTTPDGDDAPVLDITYHVAAYPPPPPGVPQLNDVLPFRVTQVAYHDRPAGDSVHVTVVPAWQAPAPEGEQAAPGE